MSVQLSYTEVPETGVKAWKGPFKTAVAFVGYLYFAQSFSQARIIVLLFYYDSAIYWACAQLKKIWHLVHAVHFL